MRKTVLATLLIILAIASCTKKSAPTTTKEPAIDGAPIYAQNCARCHGATGREGRAPNLAEGGHTKAEIIDAVSNGAGRMPSFADKLKPAEIEAVAVYVTQLGKK